MPTAFKSESNINLPIDKSSSLIINYEIYELSNGRADIFYKKSGAGWSNTTVIPNKGDVDKYSSELSGSILNNIQEIALTIQVRPHYQTQKYRFVCWATQNDNEIEGSFVELKGSGSSAGFEYMLVKYKIK